MKYQYNERFLKKPKYEIFEITTTNIYRNNNNSIRLFIYRDFNLCSTISFNASQEFKITSTNIVPIPI